MLNPERIWHLHRTDLSTSSVICSHFTLGNQKKSFFNIIIHRLLFRLFMLPQKKTNSNCFTAACFNANWHVGHWWRQVGNWTLRTRNISALRHFGTVQMGPKCRDISAPVPKCPKDTSDLSTEVSSPMVGLQTHRAQNSLDPRPFGTSAEVSGLFGNKTFRHWGSAVLMPRVRTIWHDAPLWVIEPSRWLLLERGMLFRRLFVLRHRCCSSAATSRRHCMFQSSYSSP